MNNKKTEDEIILQEAHLTPPSGIAGSTITSSLSGAVGAALIAGSMFGPVGAVVGASIGAAIAFKASGKHPDWAWLEKMDINSSGFDVVLGWLVFEGHR